jgi:hypothetical protein
MNKLKNILLTSVLALGLATSAFAFEGFSIGAVAVDGSFDTKGQEHKSAKATGVNATTKGSVSEDVNFGSVFAEYTFAQGSTIGFEYIPGDASVGTKSRTMTQSDSQNASGTITAKGEISDHITFYVEPTIMATDTFGIYVKGGASRVTVNSLEKQTSTSIASVYGNQDVWGVTYGVGAKAYYGNIFAKLEHMTTEYGTVALTSTAGNKNTVEADIEQTSTRLAVGYNF